MSQNRDAVTVIGGQPFGNPAVGVALLNDTWFVDGTTGRDRVTYGKQKWSPVATIQAAVTAALSGDMILVAPGTYAETVTIPRGKALTIVGLGGKHAARIVPATNGNALVNSSDDVSLVNLALVSNGTGNALMNNGSRLSVYGCRIQGGTIGVALTRGTAAQVTAGTHGTCALARFEDCSIKSNTTGVVLTCSDGGAISEATFLRCRFGNNTAADFAEVVAGGGAAATVYRELLIDDCTFGLKTDGTAPTKFILLNGDNANSGVVSGCRFPTALAGGLNLVSTKLLWIGNIHVAGIGGAQPS